VNEKFSRVVIFVHQLKEYTMLLKIIEILAMIVLYGFIVGTIGWLIFKDELVRLVKIPIPTDRPPTKEIKRDIANPDSDKFAELIKDHHFD